MAHTEIRIIGYGGQGVITAGHILGQAASLYAEMDAIMLKAYGPEIQGGWARADVVIDDDEVEFPYLTQPDYIIAFSQSEFERDGGSLKEDGIILAEADLVKLDPGDPHKSYSIPVVRIAEEELRRKVVANIIMLGAFTEITGLVPMEAMERALKENIPKGTEDLNLNAFRKGCEYVKKELYDPA
jgi:2-oxoglutarate ferredoxin oxidoreductase subunit gamma